jgi:lycopene cyclase domain-containing protein
VRHLTYLFVLAGCLIAAAPLEFMLGLRVRAQGVRLLLTLLPVVVVFVAWDVYAIARHQWSYDRAQTSGVLLPERLPLEELLFFLVIPVCAVLTIEAVRKVTGWSLIDDSQPQPELAEPVEPRSSR